MEHVTTAATPRLKQGATRLGLMDVLTALVLLALLLYASWKQFPAYNRPVSTTPAQNAHPH